MAAPAPPPANRVPPLLVGAGLLVMLGGFALPRLVPDPTPATVAAATDAKPTAPADGPGLGMAVGRMAVSLVVVCGLCVGVARLVARKSPPPAKGMAVAAALTVDPRCSVYLVTAGDRRLLLGVDPAGVKAVLELPGPPPEAAGAGVAGAESSMPRFDQPRGIEDSAPATQYAAVVGPVRLTDATIPDQIASLLERLRGGVGQDVSAPTSAGGLGKRG